MYLACLDWVLNSSKSAYASFTLLGNKFFSKYHYKPLRSGIQGRERFTCKIYNKVSTLVGLSPRFPALILAAGTLVGLQSCRVVDPTREKDTAVERCDVSVEDGEGKTKSRFVIKIVCRHGMSLHQIPIS